ncbi:unnamed protein product, partial [Hapterophycus canaliculatus]
MVQDEAKASLRSAVADGLLEYRRTCDTADADRVQAVLLGALSSLAMDSYVGVRLSALAAIGEVRRTPHRSTLLGGCSSDCVPAISLLLERCLDTAPKVRALAIRLLVDEFRLGIGRGGTLLAWTVLTSSQPSADTGGRQSGCNPEQVGKTPGASFSNCFGGQRGGKMGGSDDDGRRQETERGSPLLLLGQLLRHQNVLEETDKERSHLLLKGLVETILRGEDLLPRMRGEDLLPRTVRTSIADESVAGVPHISEEGNGRGAGGVSGDTTTTTGARTAAPFQTPTAVRDPLLDAWRDAGGVGWEDLAAPAARLYAACRPWDSAQLGVLDDILGEIF